MGDAHSELEPVKAIQSAAVRTLTETSRRTSEERLHLDALELALARSAEDEALDGEDALALDEELDLAVLLAEVVEADALANRGAAPSLEVERAAADGRAVDAVALGLGRDVADGLVGGVRGREVGVHLARAVSAPHEARRPAAVVAAAARARGGLISRVAAVCVRRLAKVQWNASVPRSQQPLVEHFFPITTPNGCRFVHHANN